MEPEGQSRYKTAPIGEAIRCTVIRQKSSISDQEKEQYLTHLYSALETDPIEDGNSHVAESIIADLLRHNNIYVLEWLKGICLNTKQPSFASSIVRCLGRQIKPGTPSWRADLVRDGLRVNNLEIRDSIVQAVELWEEQAILNVLRGHDEQVPWLRDYIRDILEDLTV